MRAIARGDARAASFGRVTRHFIDGVRISFRANTLPGCDITIDFDGRCWPCLFADTPLIFQRQVRGERHYYLHALLEARRWP